jgi:hypothetical protein
MERVTNKLTDWLLWKPEFHNCVHSIEKLVQVLNQTNLIQSKSDEQMRRIVGKYIFNPNISCAFVGLI